MRTLVPLGDAVPGATLSTAMVPPHPSISRRLIASPNPLPLVRTLVR